MKQDINPIPHPAYTIGHGTRKADEFLTLLKKFDIKYLLDVRSRPYSRFNPHFNQKKLQEFLKEHDITYVFMGDTLGGRPTDTTAYDIEGKVDYNLLQQKDYFKQGIERVKTALTKDLNIAMMCSERKPEDCHRSRLIGRVLFNDGIEIRHIDENGELKDQPTVMNIAGTLPF
jgi:uncharacterized protein (DUF488 family)